LRSHTASIALCTAYLSAGARVACYPAILAINRTVESDAHISKGGGSDGGPRYIIDSSSDKGMTPSSVTGDIVFRNIRFAYPARPEVDVFKYFSLKIEAGKTLALVGASGEGKSTAVGLMERFYDPDFGSVSLDGVDLKDLNVKWLRQQIGLVSQEPKLFAASIRENIASGAPGATDEQIEQAARMANAHDFIVSFPDGYNTQAGDMGTQLSGGKRNFFLYSVRACVRSVCVLDADIFFPFDRQCG
jgi:ATP-binding cassette subfamily B (MDR/TAP) protein 1